MQSTNKPLFSHSAEKNLIIAFLNSYDAILEAQASVTPVEFYYTPFKYIATVCFSLFNGGAEVDMVSIENELTKSNQLKELTEENNLWHLASLIPQGTIESNGSIVRGYYKRRETLRILDAARHQIYNEGIEIDQTVEAAQTQLINIDNSKENETKSFGELRMPTLEQSKRIKDARTNGSKSDLITPKLKSLADVIIGYGKGELILLAARPAMGKTAFAVDEAVSMARQGYKVAFFSFEMNNEEITGRILANVSASTQYNRISTGFLSKDEETELLTVGTDIENNLYIHATSALSVEKARALAIKLKIKYQIDVLIVDYLQLMSSSEVKSSRGNREQEVSSISRTLKKVAMELDIPVIALSQLSRANEARGGDKRPQLSDLRESGSLEQDANKVMFLHRPEYYGIETYEDGSDTLGITEVIVAKNRIGGVGTAKADSSEIPMSRFKDLQESNSYQPTF